MIRLLNIITLLVVIMVNGCSDMHSVITEYKGNDVHIHCDSIVVSDVLDMGMPIGVFFTATNKTPYNIIITNNTVDDFKSRSLNSKSKSLQLIDKNDSVIGLSSPGIDSIYIFEPNTITRFVMLYWGNFENIQTAKSTITKNVNYYKIEYIADSSKFGCVEYNKLVNYNIDSSQNLGNNILIGMENAKISIGPLVPNKAFWSVVSIK